MWTPIANRSVGSIELVKLATVQLSVAKGGVHPPATKQADGGRLIVKFEGQPVICGGVVSGGPLQHNAPPVKLTAAAMVKLP